MNKPSKSTPGFERALKFPLLDAIRGRRSLRIMKGLKEVHAGSATYRSEQEPEPLEPLEEALLIAVLGRTGFALPDRPFEDPKKNKILGSPNVRFIRRAAGSADNAQNTYFFMMNDSGVYLLDHLHQDDTRIEFTPDALLEYAEKVKIKVLDHRLEFPREHPFYLDTNRFVSNFPGSTIFFPVVDMTSQFINGIMYGMTVPEGKRPVILDELQGYRPAGVQRWIDNGYLNSDICEDLSYAVVHHFRAHIEAPLLLQNLMLTLQAMGLGGWIHASFESPWLLGHPLWGLPDNPGLEFRYVIPECSAIEAPDLRWLANPVGKDGLIECFCPPYYKSMSDAVDGVLELKYRQKLGYSDRTMMRSIFRGDLGDKFVAEVPRYSEEAIQICKDVCEYFHETYGRFPVTVDAIDVPGIWLQAHHLDQEYYDTLFLDAYSDTHRDHDKDWHGR